MSGKAINSSITNCSITGSISIEHCNDAMVGGIVGQGNRISGCVNKVNIYVDADKDSRYKKDSKVHCGGIVGNTQSINSALSININYGDIEVYAGDFAYIGGISGEYGKIENCLNFANISGEVISYNSYSSFAGNCNVGGIVGATSSDYTRYSVNYGNINATCAYGASSYAGGIAGYCGYYGSGRIKNCVNYNDSILSVSVDQNNSRIYKIAGRIVGHSISNGVSECYSYSQTLVNDNLCEGTATSKNGGSCTKEQLKLETTYPDFDFHDIWQMGIKDFEFPILKKVIQTSYPFGYGIIHGFSIEETKSTFNNATTYVTGNLKLMSDLEISNDILSSKVNDIVWVSSDSSIVDASKITCESVNSVDNLSAALIIGFTPKKDGTVTITGTTSNGLNASCMVTVELDDTTLSPNIIPVKNYIVSAGSEELDDSDISKEGPAELAIDGNSDTIWHTYWHNHSDDYNNQWYQIELDSMYQIDGLMYLPRQDSFYNGTVQSYKILISHDGENWKEVIADTWDNSLNDKSWRNVSFSTVKANYVRFKIEESYCDNGTICSSAAEIRLTGIRYDGNDTEPIIESFSINSDKSTFVNKETYISGSIRLSGEDVSNEYLSSEISNIVWTSSDSSVIDETQIICTGVHSVDNLSATLMISFTPKKDGTITITGTTSNGLSASCIVKVEENSSIIKSLEMDKSIYRKYNDTIVLESTLIMSEEGDASEDILRKYVEKIEFISLNTNIVEIKEKKYIFSDNYRKANIYVSLTIKGIGHTTIKGTVEDMSGQTEVYILDNTYSAELDGWSIVNGHISFGYPSNYKIPWSQYVSLYAGSSGLSALNSLWIGGQKALLSWKGSCFGMCLTSAANYENKINLKKYFSIEKSSEYLSEFGYTGVSLFRSSDSKYDNSEVYDIKDNPDVINVVERAFLSQYSKEFEQSEIGKHDSDYSELVNLLNTSENLILVNMETLTAGHTVLIDDYLGIDDEGWYRFSLYDSNCPSGSNSLNKPLFVYDDISILRLNPNNGNWQYCYYSENSWDISMSNIYRSVGHSYIRFYNVSNLSSDYYTNSLTLNFSDIYLLFNTKAEKLSINNHTNTIIAFDENGLMELGGGYDYNVLMGDDNSILRYMNLDEQKLTIESESIELILCDTTNEIGYYVSCDESCSINFDTLESKIDIVTDNNASIILEIGISDSKESYENTRVQINLPKDEKVTFMNTEEGVVIESTAEIDVDMVITDERGKTTDYKYTVNGKFFDDVCKNNYYYVPILWALKEEVTSGLTSNIFGPEESCTRGQVVTFLWRAMGRPEVDNVKNPFLDVNSSQYYYKAILWAVENGITSGLTPTTFGPEETVTRGQFVTFLHRMKEKPTYSVSNPFSDINNEQYYYDSVLWAVENGITYGLKEDLFGPEESCTRG